MARSAKVGDFVKIHDIGPLAEVLAVNQDQFYLTLDGNEFWCPSSIIDFSDEEG